MHSLEEIPQPFGYDHVINALAEPMARHTFTLESGEGPACSAHVYNDLENDTMLEATFSFAIGGDTVELPPETVEPLMNANFHIDPTNGEDLVGRTVTTIEMVDSDSVRYTYTIEQK